jgi:hypothetical protein
MMFENILRDHFLRYPFMKMQDVYKMVLQGALGSEHAVSSLEGVRKRLESEIAEMGAGPAEPTIDPISGDEQIVRVHLRPFLEQGGDPETLLTAFLRTASEFRGDIQVLKDNWQTAKEMGYFPSLEMDAFIESMRAQDYPAVHHSPEYERLYRPAYRVIWQNFI